jgi:hypothetical protein
VAENPTPTAVQKTEAIYILGNMSISEELISELNANNKLRLWVVSCCFGPPVLESRRIYTNPKTGQTRTYKQRNMDIEDIRLIAENQEDIIEALQ